MAEVGPIPHVGWPRVDTLRCVAGGLTRFAGGKARLTGLGSPTVPSKERSPRT